MSDDTLSVRRATFNDLSELATLNGFVQDLHVTSRPDVFRPAEHSGVAQWFRSFLERPNMGAWLAEQNGTAVGYILTVLHDRPETVFSRASRSLEVDQIGVLPERQRCGIGRALLDRVLQDARTNGVHEVTLRSWTFNEAAHAAFRQWGFTPQIIEFSLIVKPPV